MMAELYMYLSIYKLLINHDRKMKLVLTSASVTKRVQRNVISLAGHAVNFAVETLWSVFFLYIAHTSAKLIEIKLLYLQTRHGLHESGG